MWRNLGILILAFSITLVISIAIRVYSEMPPEPLSVNPKAGHTKASPASGPEPSGKKAPDFVFRDINEGQFTLHDFKDRIILLNFWASWCLPCVKEFPILAEITSAFPEKLVLIAVSSDQTEEDIRRFKQSLKQKTGANLDQPNIHLVHDPQKKITLGVFNTLRLPETIIINKDLKMVHKLIGADWNKNDLENRIKKLIINSDRI